MKNTLLTKKNRFTFSDICITAAYLSLAVVSSYIAFLTFDVKFPSILIFIAFFFLATLKTILNSGAKLHMVIFFLVLRFFFFLINCLVLRVDTNEITEQAVVTVCSVLIFFYCYNEFTDIGKILLPFTLLTSVQVFYAFITNGFSTEKTFIVAGIGDSNYIATFLLFSIAYYLFSKTSVIQKITLLLSVPALLLTQSFACYLALFVVGVVWVIKTVNWHSTKSVAIFVACCMVTALSCICFTNTKFGYPIVEKIKDKLTFLASGDMRNFSSSRVELYRFSIDNIKRHILFGSIKNENLMISSLFQNFRTHNLVLESLLLYGIVGSLLNIVIFYYAIKSFKRNKNMAYIMVFIAVIVHGFFEPNFFTMHFELFIWLIIGASLGEANKRGTVHV